MFVRFQVDDVIDTGGVQLIGGRGLNGERFTDDFRLRRLQGHGLTSTPNKGAEGLAVFPFGDRGRGYLLGLESGVARRKNTAAGGAVLYQDANTMVICENGKVRIISATEATVEVAGMLIKVTPSRVDLGGEGGSPVVTLAGPSTKVFAVT